VNGEEGVRGQVSGITLNGRVDFCHCEEPEGRRSNPSRSPCPRAPRAARSQ
jgi:hypothetical protein